MFRIVLDSTSSTPIAELESMGIAVVPLSVHFGEESYVDGVDLSPGGFYEKMVSYYPQGLPKTACPAPGAFEQAFRDAIGEGADGILCMTLSAGLSGTYNSALVAARSITDPSCRIEIIDSKNCVEVLSMMAEKACRMRDEGVSVAEAADHMRLMAEKTETFFGLDTMENLVRGGMVGKATGFAASALKIKPILNIAKDTGEANPAGKARGTKGLLKDTASLVENYMAANGDSMIRFCHADALERVAEVKAFLDTKDITYSDREPGWIGSVIGTYSGRRGIGVCLCPKNLL